MTDQPPPTYPDPLRDALASAGQTAVSLATVAAMTSTIVVGRRAAQLHAAAGRAQPDQPARAGHAPRRRPARSTGPRGAGSVGEAAAAGVRADRDRAEAADAVRAVLDGPLAAAVIAADEFDAMAGRLAATARRFGLDHQDTLRIAAEMIHRGIGADDVRSAAAVLWARLGWLADPASAPDWARRAAESAHTAASNRAGQARDVIDGEVVTPTRGTGGGDAAKRPTPGGPSGAKQPGRAGGAGEAAAAGVHAARDRAEATAAVRAVFGGPLAQRVLDGVEFDAMAGQLAASARRTGLDHQAALQAAVYAVPVVLDAVRSPASELRAWLDWLADPAHAPAGMRNRMRDFRDRAGAAGAVRAVLDGSLAQRAQDGDARVFSSFAEELARTARGLGLSRQAALHAAVSAFPEVLSDGTHDLASLLGERLVWLADPSRAPDRVRPVAESAHAAARAQAAAAARSSKTAAGETPASGTATGHSAADVAGTAFPAKPGTAVPPDQPTPSARPAPSPPSAQPGLGR